MFFDDISDLELIGRLTDRYFHCENWGTKEKEGKDNIDDCQRIHPFSLEADK